MPCIVGRIQPIRIWKPRVLMCVCGPNNVARAVRTDPTLLRYRGLSRLEIFVPILAKFHVPVSPVLFFEILRGHIASPPRAKIGQALSPCERELVLINNVLTSAIKATKKELFIGTLHALSSNILRLALCRRRESFLRGS